MISPTPLSSPGIWTAMAEWLCCLSQITQTMYTDYVWHTPTVVARQCVWGSSSDWAEELCVRPAFSPELQLVIVVGRTLGFRNYLQIVLYIPRWDILSFFSRILWCLCRKLSVSTLEQGFANPEIKIWSTDHILPCGSGGVASDLPLLPLCYNRFLYLKFYLYLWFI